MKVSFEISRTPKAPKAFNPETTPVVPLTQRKEAVLKRLKKTGSIFSAASRKALNQAARKLDELTRESEPCPNCHEPMVGDGITQVEHCPRTIPNPDDAPDSGPIFCQGTK